MGRKKFVCATIGKGMDFSIKKKVLLKKLKERKDAGECYGKSRKCGSV